MKRVAILLLVASSPVRADEATAQAAYKQAEALAKQNKWAEACPLYEASYRDDQQLGVLMHLADCHEHVGRIATAWAEFTDAIDLAHSKSDSREALARKRADALAPRLAKLHLAPPATLIPGLIVKRDGIDITVLVGTDMPIDPGDHQIVAAAPGYLDWTSTVAITGATTTPLAIPPLDKIPEKQVIVEPPKVHEGMVVISTQPDALILLDSQEVGTGHYEGKIRSGGHTLRVTADGMIPYQSEIVIADDDKRTIDVPLVKVPAAVVITAPPPVVDDTPGFELGANMATGVKLRGDRPLVVAFRADVAFRIGRRVNFGLFAEYGSLSTSGSCGFNMAGPMPASPYDFGARNQFNRCSYAMPGLQLYVHVLPKRPIDPYLGITPGFRFGFTDWTPYLAGVPQPRQSDLFPAIVVGARAGVDYHPTPELKAWEVGAFVEASITAYGQEAMHDSPEKGQTFVSMFGGLRSSLAF